MNFPVDLLGCGQLDNRHKADSTACETASEVSAAHFAAKTAGDYWAEVIESDARENQRVARRVMGSFRHLRPLFLWAFRWVFRVWSGLRVTGLEHLPAAGPYILAANHECHLDNLFVACFLPRPVQRRMVVLSKKEHFAHWPTRLFAVLCHGVPVDRGQISAGVLGVCSQALRQDGVLLIHPEGTRSPDGQLLPFRKGVAVLAHHVRCPVIPVHIEGAHEFWPKHSWFPRRRSRISVRIGPPMLPGTMTSQSAKEFTEQLMVNILALSNEPTERIGPVVENS